MRGILLVHPLELRLQILGEPDLDENAPVVTPQNAPFIAEIE
jgi:hypothetical protein